MLIHGYYCILKGLEHSPAHPMFPAGNKGLAGVCSERMFLNHCNYLSVPGVPLAAGWRYVLKSLEHTPAHPLFPAGNRGILWNSHIPYSPLSLFDAVREIS